MQAGARKRIMLSRYNGESISRCFHRLIHQMIVERSLVTTKPSSGNELSAGLAVLVEEPSRDAVDVSRSAGKKTSIQPSPQPARSAKGLKEGHGHYALAPDVRE